MTKTFNEFLKEDKKVVRESNKVYSEQDIGKNYNYFTVGDIIKMNDGFTIKILDVKFKLHHKECITLLIIEYRDSKTSGKQSISLDSFYYTYFK